MNIEISKVLLHSFFPCFRVLWSFFSFLQVKPQHFGTVPEPESAQDEAAYRSRAFNFHVSIFFTLEILL